MLMDKIKLISETMADWLDDRWTWAAIGLATGYFGFGSPDTLEWQAWQELGIAGATLVLVLVRDTKRRPLETKQKAGWNDASEITPIELTGKSEDSAASPFERSYLRHPREPDGVADDVQSVLPGTRSNPTEAIDKCNPNVSASNGMRELPTFGNNHKRPPNESGWNDRSV